MEIKRDYYLNKLIRRKHNGLIKVITGVRRCGKSYLLNTLFYNHLLNNGIKKDHIIRFAFDSADDLYLMGASLIKEKQTRKNSWLIFVLCCQMMGCIIYCLMRCRCLAPLKLS